MESISKKYYFLFFLIMVIYVTIVPLFRIDGGLADDFFGYLKIIRNFPNQESNMYPIGYPLVIKVLNIFVHDYFYTSKILNILLIIFIGIFSYYNKFFFKETVIVLGFKTFNAFLFSLSESLFLVILYLIMYCYYNLFKNNFFKLKYTILIPILFAMLVTVKYSGIFIYIGVLLYTLLLFIKHKRINKKIKMFLITNIISGILISIYLIYNYFTFNSFMGTRGDGAIQNMSTLKFLFHFILYPFFTALNPIIDVIRLNNVAFIISLFVSFLSFLYFIILFFQYIKKGIDSFHAFLLLIAGVAFLLLVYSIFFTKIDALHHRLGLPIIFLVYFVLIAYYLRKNIRFEIIFILIMFSSLFSNFIINSIDTFPYFQKKKNLENYIDSRPEIQFYFNDIGKIPTETGGQNTLNFGILTMHKKGINILSKDLENRIIDKRKVIYESEMKNIKPINRTNWNKNIIFW